MHHRLVSSESIFWSIESSFYSLTPFSAMHHNTDDTLALNKKEEEKKDPVDLPDTPQV